MATKRVPKDMQRGNIRLLSTDSTDNPKLYAKTLSDGRESLYLEFYFGYRKVYDERKDMEVVKHDRRKEFLHRYLWQAPRTPLEKQHNKDTLELAKKIRYERQEEFKENKDGYRLRKDRNINFLEYFQIYIDGYTKKDKRNLQLALKRFKSFLIETPEYKKYKDYLRPDQITKDMMEAFTEYLQATSTGEGGHTLYQRFKKVINYAIEHDVMLKNPCKGVTICVDEQMLRKDVLSVEEIETLIQTHVKQENPEIRRAFIFCLYTGLRFCDVKDLTFSNVDYSNKLLHFEQNKTRGHSASSGVIIPLNDGLLGLIGEQQQRDVLIFNLPSHTMCLKALRHWTAKAGIAKHITWHCARHSFAVNILNNGANIKTVSSLLGHSTLRHTEKYTRAVDKLKADAIDSLPALNLANL